MSGNIFSRTGGLVGKVFDLGCDHGKAFAGLTSAGGLNGCIERKQVCLFGNRLDQFDDFTDFVRCTCKFGKDLAGIFGLVRARLCDIGTAGNLRGDFINRCCQLLGCCGDGVYVGRSLFCGCRNIGRLVCGQIRLARHFRCCAAQLGQGCIDTGQVAFDIVLECLDTGIDTFGAFNLLLICGFLFLLQAVGFLAAFKEYFKRACKIADFILAVLAIGCDRCIALCDTR